MTNKYYVALTGSKNNAGDHLIKHRAFDLLARLRTDRQVVDINGWEAVDESKLQLINGAEALLFLGGPALSPHMIPRVYNVDITRVKVPVITFGIGWHSPATSLETDGYKLSTQTLLALEKINGNPFPCSVRDAPTKSVLNNYGLNKFELTGCPALFDLTKAGVAIQPYSRAHIRRAGFSLGVSLKQSRAMEDQMKQALLEVRHALPQTTEVVVAFHHSLGDSYRRSHGFNKRLAARQLGFTRWLRDNAFEYLDISGTHENLIRFYDSVDLHVGYRVHAHIYMTSQNKPSILIAEDGRGSGLRETIGGAILDGVETVDTSFFARLLTKAGAAYETYITKKQMLSDLRGLLVDESRFDESRRASKQRVNALWPVMKRFVESLP